MRIRFKIFSLVYLVTALPFYLFAQANYTWTNAAGTNRWGNAANWSCVGASCSGTYPGNGVAAVETVTFNNTSVANCLLDVDFAHPPRSGTITSSIGSSTITGVGTSFTTQLVPGDYIYDNTGALLGRVASVVDDFTLGLQALAASTKTGVNFSATARLSDFDIATTYTGTLDLNGRAINVKLANSTACVLTNARINDSGGGTAVLNFSSSDASLTSGRTVTFNGGTYDVNVEISCLFGISGSSGTSAFTVSNSVNFRKNFYAVAPNCQLSGARFDGTTSIYRTIYGSGAGWPSAGGNVFNGTTTIGNSIASGSINFDLGTNNDFNGDVTFNHGSSVGTFSLTNTTLAGNLTVTRSGGLNNSRNVNFLGSTTFDGSLNQTITVRSFRNSSNADFYDSFNFANIIFNKSSGAINLANGIISQAVGSVPPDDDNPIVITGMATFTWGIVNSIPRVYLSFADDASATGANNTSFVTGLVSKTGNDPFVFPLGTVIAGVGYYRPVSITAPANTTDKITARYYFSSPGSVTSFGAGIAIISDKEYWELAQPSGSSALNITMGWSENVPGIPSNYVTNYATMRVVNWNGSAWNDLGGASITPDNTVGSVTTGGTTLIPSVTTKYTLGSSNVENVLPVKIEYFKAFRKNNLAVLQWQTASELNNQKFVIERSIDGLSFEPVFELPGNGTSNIRHRYSWTDENTPVSRVYFRLLQIDFDDQREYLGIVFLDEGEDLFSMWPVPVASGDLLYFSKSSDVEVLDQNGNILLKEKGVSRIALSSFLPGIYFLREGQGSVRKFTVK